MKQIVLASLSPRRKELLERTGLEFLIEDSGFKEDTNSKLEPRELAEHFSYCKAKAVSEKHPDSIIIAADTIVVLNNKILGKPKNSKDAINILKKLSGKTHKVITGFTILDACSNKIVTKSTETKVIMRKFTDDEVTSYVNTGEPLDKAGAYGIQGLGGFLIKGIEGDYYNVVGLPLTDLLVELKRFGIRIL